MSLYVCIFFIFLLYSVWNAQHTHCTFHKQCWSNADYRCESVPKDKPKHIKNCSTIHSVPTSSSSSCPFPFFASSPNVHWLCVFLLDVCCIVCVCYARSFVPFAIRYSLSISISFSFSPFFTFVRLFVLSLTLFVVLYTLSFIYVWGFSSCFVCSQYKYDVISMVIERRRFGRCNYCEWCLFCLLFVYPCVFRFFSLLAELWVVLQFCFICSLRATIQRIN